LVGITVNNTFILVNNIHLKKSQDLGLLAQKTYDRIRPIFLTTITTVVGLVPLVIFEDSNSFWYPFAVATIGGMTTSSLLQLVFIPLIMGRVKKK
jgi:multidrug efflux pump subunit AcrB